MGGRSGRRAHAQPKSEGGTFYLLAEGNPEHPSARARSRLLEHSVLQLGNFCRQREAARALPAGRSQHPPPRTDPPWASPRRTKDCPPNSAFRSCPEACCTRPEHPPSGAAGDPRSGHCQPCPLAPLPLTAAPSSALGPPITSSLSVFFPFLLPRTAPGRSSSQTISGENRNAEASDSSPQTSGGTGPTSAILL